MNENGFENININEHPDLTPEEALAHAEKIEEEKKLEVNVDLEGINRLLKEMGFPTKDQKDDEEEFEQAA